MELNMANVNNVFQMIINNSMDGNKESPKNKKPLDISKLVFEELIDSKMGNVKIFFFSEMSTGNNKPYTYNKKITFSKYSEIHMCKEKLSESKSSEAESIFDDLSSAVIVAPAETDADRGNNAGIIPQETTSGPTWDNQTNRETV